MENFKTGTAGYILEDGNVVYLNDYHGEDSDLCKHKELPEFSNTHAEEDTCIRIYSEPNKNQYTSLEKIIDIYLDNEGYCKIEIWNNDKYIYYKVYSLYEGACEDNTFSEIVGNWTGYDLVKIVKNQFRKTTEDLISEIYPNKGESKKDFIARFMKATKGEYPDVKQRYAVANSYWDRRNLKEASRSEIISKAKKGQRYNNSSDNRWTRKTDATVASTVKDYNKIDMDTFWKKDLLTFGIKVEGKTSTYLVNVSFKDIFPELQKQVKSNKNKLTPELIYKVLLTAINSGDVHFNCDCPDYRYRLKYFASQNGYNFGEKETRKSEKTNPDDAKGPACKHILSVLNNLEWLKKIASVINNYINYCKDKMEYNYARFIFPQIYGMDYEKAVQLTIDDFDDKGNLRNNLDSDEATINLANAIGKTRGRFKKKNN